MGWLIKGGLFIAVGIVFGGGLFLMGYPKFGISLGLIGIAIGLFLVYRELHT
jgi:hypothetical protein